MKGRERIQAILNRKPADRVGFWLGNPSDDAKFLYYKHLGIPCEAADTWVNKSNIYTTYSGVEDIQMGNMLNSDLMWIAPDLDVGTYKHPEGKPIFDVYGGREFVSLGMDGVFAECEDVAEVERFTWPNPDYMDFSGTMDMIDKTLAQDMAVFSSMWGAFFHTASDFFGMENYFIKMHTDPAVVEAVTEHIVEFHLECNKRLYELAGDKIDCIFFGNDIGTQINPIMSPEFFKRFLLPYMKRIINQAKSYGKKVALHSCGSIAQLLPMIIDAGIDVLHPLQAKAVGMDAESLAREYKKDLIFMGGVDTQELLPFGTAQQVKDEVHRLREVFGPNFIVSPSHEAILPNVPLENMIAMRDAAID